MNLKKIKDLCDAKRISIDDLAKKVFTNNVTLYRVIERNDIKAKMLENICLELNVKPCIFFTETVHCTGEKELQDDNDHLFSMVKFQTQQIADFTEHITQLHAIIYEYKALTDEYKDFISTLKTVKL